MKRCSPTLVLDTLPVFACAAAVAALHWLRHRQPIQSVPVDLIEPAETRNSG